MRKTLMLCFIFLSLTLYAKENVYTSNVKNLYETSTSTKAKGRLLPTTKVKIIEKKGSMLKVEITGFMKNGVSRAIYFVKGKRILVAGLSKSASFKIKTISSSTDENGVKWEEVSVIAFIKDDKLTNDLDSLYKLAQNTFKDNCSMCHPIHPSTEFTANQWPSMVKSMITRTAMTKEQKYLVTQYLQKHAKDMKGE